MRLDYLYCSAPISNEETTMSDRVLCVIVYAVSAAITAFTVWLAIEATPVKVPP
jgi:hypothetical protein